MVKMCQQTLEQIARELRDKIVRYEHSNLGLLDCYGSVESRDEIIYINKQKIAALKWALSMVNSYMIFGEEKDILEEMS